MTRIKAYGGWCLLLLCSIEHHGGPAVLTGPAQSVPTQAMRA